MSNFFVRYFRPCPRVDARNITSLNGIVHWQHVINTLRYILVSQRELLYAYHPNKEATARLSEPIYRCFRSAYSPLTLIAFVPTPIQTYEFSFPADEYARQSLQNDRSLVGRSTGNRGHVQRLRHSVPDAVLQLLSEPQQRHRDTLSDRKRLGLHRECSTLQVYSGENE